MINLSTPQRLVLEAMSKDGIIWRRGKTVTLRDGESLQDRVLSLYIFNTLLSKFYIWGAKGDKYLITDKGLEALNHD